MQLTQQILNQMFHQEVKKAQQAGLRVPVKFIEAIKLGRGYKRIGHCQKAYVRNTVAFTITVSKYITEEQDIRNVLMHEIIHTLPNCFNHGDNFKQAANVIHKHFPAYKISRLTAATLAGMCTFQCTKCGKAAQQSKHSKVIKELDSYRCRCGGKLHIV